tara:strand:+ start:5600 stop:5722 length:123 start_codon:yes stop_codon:yes gene_type:complete
MLIKTNYKPKVKNELALKKYIKQNADKKQPKRTTRGNRSK